MNIGSKLNQTAVYWAPGAPDGAGNRTYAAGVELTAAIRWQNRRIEFTNVLGKKELSQAIVYFDGAGTAIALGGKLYLGTSASLTAGQIANPSIVTLAYRVKQNDVSPSVDASQSLRKAIL